MVSDNFKLIYFSSFVDEESAVFNDLCLQLHDLDRKYNMNIFTFYSRISNKNVKRWDQEFINEKLKNEENIKKAFICGPTKFLNDIKQILLDSEMVRSDIIHLV